MFGPRKLTKSSLAILVGLVATLPIIIGLTLIPTASAVMLKIGH